MTDRQKCYRLHSAWKKLVRKEMKWTSLRRKIEDKQDRGKSLTRADKDRLSTARQKENVLGREMLRIVDEATNRECEIDLWSPVPVRRASSKAPPHARRSFRSSRQKLFASMTCRPQCQHLAESAQEASMDGDDKLSAHYGNRYWRCVEDCYEHELPRSERRKEGKQRRQRRRYR